MDYLYPTQASEEESFLAEVSTLALCYAGEFLPREAAEDLAQDVVLKCLRNLRRGKNRMDIIRLGGFIRRIVRRRWIDAIRERRCRARHEAEHARATAARGTCTWMSPALIIDECELDVFLAEALANLPPTRRRVFMMVREDKASYQAVASELGVTRGAVNAHIVAVHRLLRRELLRRGLAAPPRVRGRALRCDSEMPVVRSLQDDSGYRYAALCGATQ